MNRRSEALTAYVADLERRVSDLARNRARERAGRELAEADAEAARADADALYVARSDSGRVLYEGPHEASAIAAAREHLRIAHEHVTIDGSTWNTRQHGGTRRRRL